MTSDLTIPRPTTVVPTPTPTCAGTTYTIQPGDNCHSISLSQGIGTEWLILENDLAAFCHDFPTEGELCLVNTCTVHTVLESDTCKSIAKANDITEAQLRAWNPVSLTRGTRALDHASENMLTYLSFRPPVHQRRVLQPEPDGWRPAVRCQTRNAIYHSRAHHTCALDTHHSSANADERRERYEHVLRDILRS